MADAPALPSRLARESRIARLGYFAREQTYMFSLVLAIGLIIANTAVLPAFLSTSQIPGELGTLAPFALCALASTPAILVGGGGIDLSVAPLMGFSNIVLVVWLMPAGLASPELAIPLLLLLGAAVGAVNGFLIAVLRYPPVIATLAVYFILGGIDLEVAPNPVSSYPGWTVDLANSVAHVPGTIFTVGVVLVLWFFFRRTAYYGHLLAVGDDDVAAYSSGVNVTAVRILAYVMCGVLSAFAGIALTGQIQSADTTVWPSFVLIALAAVALGGTKLSGGRGGFLGSALGALCVYCINTLLTELGVDVFYIPVAYGAVLLVAVVAGSSLGTTSTRWTRGQR